MTELSFLVDLLVNHKLPKATAEVVLARLKEVEVTLAASREIQFPLQPRMQHQVPGPLPGPPQAASTMAILARNPDLAAAIPDAPVKVENIAQTPATAAAMASRQKAIAASMAGTVDKETGRPRKF